MCLQTNILGSSSYERRETADFGFAFILWQTTIEKLMASILSMNIGEYRAISFYSLTVFGPSIFLLAKVAS